MTQLNRKHSRSEPDKERPASRFPAVAASAVVIGLGVAFSIGSPASADDADRAPIFTFETVTHALEQGKSVRALRELPVTEDGATANDFGLTALDIDGESASVNYSLVRDGAGAISAATPEFVDLSWSPMEGVDEYVVSSADRVLGVTDSTAFRDSGVAPGSTVQYQISAYSFEDTASDNDAPIHGLTVDVPMPGNDKHAAAEAQVQKTASTAAEYTHADLTWITFIPESRIDAPPVGVPGVGCQYQSGYQFGGDNRGFASDRYASSAAGYRSYLNANIAWSRGSGIVQTDFYLGTTHVYEKSTGNLVGAQTLSTSDAIGEARLLGTDFYNTYADVRMELQAGNPFCDGNSIEGAFTATVTRTAYTISSGAHRQMPNHEIFLQGNPSGPATVVYRRPYASALCLVQLACPSAQMGGYAGGF